MFNNLGDPRGRYLLNLFSTLLASQVLWSYSGIRVGRPLIGRPAVRCRRILGQDTERQTAPDDGRLSVSDRACEWLASSDGSGPCVASAINV